MNRLFRQYRIISFPNGKIIGKEIGYYKLVNLYFFLGFKFHKFLIIYKK